MKKYTVVIVDDNPDWCRMLERAIGADSAFEVLCVLHNGKQAADYLDYHQPDVVVLDLVLPVYDGLYLIEHIREQVSHYRPCIYVLSAIGTEKTNRILGRMDVDYYSIKPIDPVAAARTLRRLVTKCGEPEPLRSLPDTEKLIEDYLYELGAPLHLLSTKDTCAALSLCLHNEKELLKVTGLYRKVAELLSGSATSASVERNIRSTVKNIQKQGRPFFLQCFPQEQKRLSNANFLNRSVYLLKRRMEKPHREPAMVRGTIL